MIPIVFINVGNPIAMGLVESLSRPGRNATGFSDIQTDLAGKLVDIARELRNAELTVGYIWHTGWPDGENRYRATERAAELVSMKLRSRGIFQRRRNQRCHYSDKEQWNNDAHYSALPVHLR